MFAIALAVQLPFFFSVGFTRARLMTSIPVAVVVATARVVTITLSIGRYARRIL